MEEEQKICCGSLIDIAPFIGWFTLGDTELAVMPYILGTSPKMRVNHCPSCGEKIRDIVILKSRLGL